MFEIKEIDYTKGIISGIYSGIDIGDTIEVGLEVNGQNISFCTVKNNAFVFNEINFKEVVTLNIFLNKGDQSKTIRKKLNTTILLARQRTGTNVLRRFLNSHNEIFSINEIFDPGVYNAITYMHYDNLNEMIYSQSSDLIGSFFPYHFKLVGITAKPISYKQAFLKYLDHISFFSKAKHNIIDIKYNHIHNITEYVEPILNKKMNIFDIIRKNNLKVINLTRKNYLRIHTSGQLAQKSGNYVLIKDSQKKEHENIKIEINVDQLLYSMKIMREEDQFIEDNLKDYDNYIMIEYDEMFDKEGKFNLLFSTKMADFLDVENQFNRNPMLKKLQNRTLKDIILNYQEVADKLRETDFAYCLD